MKNNSPGAQNLLHARKILPGNAHDHVHKLGCTKRLAHHGPHAQIFGFFLGIFYVDGIRERHASILSHEQRTTAAMQNSNDYASALKLSPDRVNG
jgi:hypothetical protein